MKNFWYVITILLINFSIVVIGIRISKLNDFYKDQIQTLKFQIDAQNDSYKDQIQTLKFQIDAQRAYEGELAKRINILYEETGCVCKLENTCNEK